MADVDREPERRRNIVIISPHFDDVPLSLGESLRSGSLRRHRVRVRTVFGRTNWTAFVHPTPGRAPAISLWRRFEETLASALFHYRWTAADWPEVVLRTENLDSSSFLDGTVDLSGEPLVDEIGSWLTDVAASATGPTAGPGGTGRAIGSDGTQSSGVDATRRWSDPPDLVLVPAGLGGHLDHMIIATAASRVLVDGPVPVGFYEDRPYRAYVTDQAVEARIAQLIGQAEPFVVSGEVRRRTQTMIRLCYPSQMTSYFREAMELDREGASAETVWFPVGGRPVWLTGEHSANR